MTRYNFIAVFILIALLLITSSTSQLNEGNYSDIQTENNSQIMRDTTMFLEDFNEDQVDLDSIEKNRIKDQIKNNFHQKYLGFVENKGQFINSKYLYYYKYQDTYVAFSTSSISFIVKTNQYNSNFNEINEESHNKGNFRELYCGKQNDKIQYDNSICQRIEKQYIKFEITFSESKTVDPIPNYELNAKFNYFRGNSSYSDVKNFKEIWYHDIYENIDLKYYINKDGLKYDFIVREGASPSSIEMNVLSTNPNFSFKVQEDRIDYYFKETKILSDANLFVKQEHDNPSGKFIEKIASQFHLSDQKRITFSISEYDLSKDLIIDPFVIGHSTYLGESQEDWIHHIEVDSSGQVYIIGRSEDFPVTSGAYDTFQSGSFDVFVAKFNNDLSNLIFATYLGSSDFESGWGLELDSSNNIYVTGYTNSTTFPTSGAYDGSHNGLHDVFVTKIASDGASLVYSTFIGGSSVDWGLAITLDDSDNAYVTGLTVSTDYPTTSGVFDESFTGTWDIFVTKVSSVGNSLSYSTYIGGDEEDWAFDIEVDSSGNAYITGRTENSLSTDYPTTSGAYDETHNGGFDAFATKLSSDGTSLIFSTVIGNTFRDSAFAIEIDDSNNVYIAGRTSNDDFPVTSGAYDETHNGNRDIFVTKFSSTGSSLLFSTFIGGSDDDIAEDLVLDSNNNIIVVGETQSSGSGQYPTTSSAYSSTFLGFDDGVISQLASDGASLLYSTLFNSEGDEGLWAVTVDSSDNIFIAGVANSGFPTTSGSFSETFGGEIDGIAAVFHIDTDGDGMSDVWEDQNGLDKNTDDSSLDPDNDELSNLIEFQIGTNPNDADTDADGMEDGYEYEYDLDPLVNDANQDKDGDGLTNKQESDLNSNPSDSDTDGDGMDDLYEFNNSLNILSDDAESDKDGDGLTNIEEFNLGTSANNIDTDGDTMDDFYEDTYGLNPLIDDSGDDLDDDGLSNLQEYNIGTLPNDSDSDNDGMSDGIEVKYELDPLVDDADLDKDNDDMPNGFEVEFGLNPNDPSDATQDKDGDGLNNLNEYQFGTSPIDTDTDNDGLDDNYEFLNGLNGTDEDTDGDNMNDGWEVDNDLNPLVNDASGDKDEDGLTNLEESELGTSANNPDTDSDSMTDQWEVNNNLNPLQDDASEDKDGDGLSNLEEFELGTDPNDIDTDGDGDTDFEEINRNLDPLNSNSNSVNRALIIGLTAILLIIGVVGAIKLSKKMMESKKLGEEMDTRGFSSIEEMQSSLNAGFENSDIKSEAVSKGFSTLKTYNTVKKLGFGNADDLKNHLDRMIDPGVIIPSKTLVQKLMNVETIAELDQIQSDVNTYVNKNSEKIDSLKKINNQLDQLNHLYQERIVGIDNKRLISKIGPEDIDNYQSKLNKIVKSIELENQLVQNAVADRRLFLEFIYKSIFKDVSSNIRNWWNGIKSNYKVLTDGINSLNYEESISQVKNAKSPAELDEVINDIEEKLDELKVVEDDVLNETVHEILSGMSLLFSDETICPNCNQNTDFSNKFCIKCGASVENLAKIKNQSLTSFKKDDIIEFYKRIQTLEEKVGKNNKQLRENITKKREWFKPYSLLLNLIQEVRDGAEINIEAISKSIKTDEEHAQSLLLLLLENHPELGNFYRLERTYVKGSDIGSTIDDLIDQFEKHEQRDRRKF